MSFAKSFEDARARLGLGPDADPATFKRAYRRATREHPPDRDPEGFRAIRAAWDLLEEPFTRGEELLHRTWSSSPKPDLPVEPAPDPQELHVLLLRRAVLEVRVDDLLGREG